VHAGKVNTGVNMMQNAMVAWMRSSLHVLVRNWRLNFEEETRARAKAEEDAKRARMQEMATIKMRRTVMRMKNNTLGIGVSDWRLAMHSYKLVAAEEMARQADVTAQRGMCVKESLQAAAEEGVSTLRHAEHVIRCYAMSVETLTYHCVRQENRSRYLKAKALLRSVIIMDQILVRVRRAQSMAVVRGWQANAAVAHHALPLKIHYDYYEEQMADQKRLYRLGTTVHSVMQMSQAMWRWQMEAAGRSVRTWNEHVVHANHETRIQATKMLLTDLILGGDGDLVMEESLTDIWSHMDKELCEEALKLDRASITTRQQNLSPLVHSGPTSYSSPPTMSKFDAVQSTLLDRTLGVRSVLQSTTFDQFDQSGVITRSEWNTLLRRACRK